MVFEGPPQNEAYTDSGSQKWGENWTSTKPVLIEINQSINQTSVAPISLGKARLRGATAESVFNSQIEETVP